MKHILKYKLFENNKFLNLKEIINTLNDYLLEISDLGLKYKIYPNDDIKIKVKSLNMDISKSVQFYIEIEGNVRFSFKELIDVIESIGSYMESNGYETNVILDNPQSVAHRLRKKESFNYKNLNIPYMINFYKNIHFVDSVKLEFN